MKSWKTTLGGLLMFLGTAASYYPHPLAQKIGPAVVGLGGLLTGASARDNNVTSEQAGIK